MDSELESVCRMFDYGFSGTSIFTLPDFDAPRRDGSWHIGVIVGPSGSGKSTLLKRQYGLTDSPAWDSTKAIVSQVSHERLSAVGLNSVPTWCRPFQVLSTGEAFRANMAKAIGPNTSFDEFTSTIDRTVALACSYAVSRLIHTSGFKGVVFSTCHYDILDWLNPDWIFDTQTGCLSFKGCLRQRKQIQIGVFECGSNLWPIFGPHHYLNGDMNKSARCFVATWGPKIVGFASALAFPNGNLKNAWREHRTVILPDYQGLGIGVRLSDFVAKMFVENGKRYFSKTSHPRMGEYREQSPSWRGTSKNKKGRADYLNSRRSKESNYKTAHAARVCFSHEFVL